MESDQNQFLTELRRRSAAYRAATTTARDVDDVMTDLRKRQPGADNRPQTKQTSEPTD